MFQEISGGSRRGAQGACPVPLILGDNKKKFTGGRKAVRASKRNPPSAPLAQGLGLPLLKGTKSHLTEHLSLVIIINFVLQFHSYRHCCLAGHDNCLHVSSVNFHFLYNQKVIL